MPGGKTRNSRAVQFQRLAWGRYLFGRIYCGAFVEPHGVLWVNKSSGEGQCPVPVGEFLRRWEKQGQDHDMGQRRLVARAGDRAGVL